MADTLYPDPDELESARLVAAGFVLVRGMWQDPADGARLLKGEALRRLDRREEEASET